MNETSIRKASIADFNVVTTMLKSASLPVEGVAEHFQNFLVAEVGGMVVGAIGLEVYGDTALLRSAVVHPDWQGSGVGTKLYNALLTFAKVSNIRRFLLLTDTAEKFFERKGFKRIDAQSVTGPIRASVEFTGACPSTAVCMELTW